MSSAAETNVRPEPDQVLVDIADYVMQYETTSGEARETARYSLMDALGCGMLALEFPECTKLLGPVVPGTVVPHGARVPGTSFELDPVKAAFDIGCIIRWLDFNDTWLAAEWGHPSDNLGSILAVADYLSRRNIAEGKDSVTMGEVLTCMVMAHEIQGCLALENSFNRVGFDHVLLVKVASTAVITRLLGGTKEQIINALSQVWVDGQSLRTYRHAPNTGSRKSWAAGDAASRAVRLAMITLQGEMGYPSALSAPTWGFYDVSFAGKPFRFQRRYGSYVMENVLFKIAYPAEFHAQTAVEAAVKLHPQVRNRLSDIEKIIITTHESAIRIISKAGKLYNPADRDHCLQYMTAIGLIFGTLTAGHYEEAIAADPRIDSLRERMEVVEESRYSREYMEPDKRSIANAVQIFFSDGTCSERVEVEYPLGHRRRRSEGIPLLLQKFKHNLAARFPEERVNRIFTCCQDQQLLENTPVSAFMELFVW